VGDALELLSQVPLFRRRDRRADVTHLLFREHFIEVDI
jgi:hypothetical protein